MRMFAGYPAGGLVKHGDGMKNYHFLNLLRIFVTSIQIKNDFRMKQLIIRCLSFYTLRVFQQKRPSMLQFLSIYSSSVILRILSFINFSIQRSMDLLEEPDEESDTVEMLMKVNFYYRRIIFFLRIIFRKFRHCATKISFCATPQRGK